MIALFQERAEWHEGWSYLLFPMLPNFVHAWLKFSLWKPNETSQGFERPSFQVFEMDKKLLQVHAMPYIAAYTWEKGTLMRALDMDEFLPPRIEGVPEEELRLRSRRLPRRQQRKMRYCVVILFTAQKADLPYLAESCFNICRKGIF